MIGSHWLSSKKLINSIMIMLFTFLTWNSYNNAIKKIQVLALKLLNFLHSKNSKISNK